MVDLAGSFFFTIQSFWILFSTGIQKILTERYSLLSALQCVKSVWVYGRLGSYQYLTRIHSIIDFETKLEQQLIKDMNDTYPQAHTVLGNVA